MRCGSSVTSLIVYSIHPNDEQKVVKVSPRLWRIFRGVYFTTLWLQRNRVTFQHANVNVAGSATVFRITDMTQLRAVPAREVRSADTKENDHVYLVPKQSI